MRTYDEIVKTAAERFLDKKETSEYSATNRDNIVTEQDRIEQDVIRETSRRFAEGRG